LRGGLAWTTVGEASAVGISGNFPRLVNVLNDGETADGPELPEPFWSRQLSLVAVFAKPKVEGPLSVRRLVRVATPDAFRLDRRVGIATAESSRKSAQRNSAANDEQVLVSPARPCKPGVFLRYADDALTLAFGSRSDWNIMANVQARPQISGSYQRFRLLGPLAGVKNTRYRSRLSAIV
jgi:hypothetical protein